MDLTPLEKAARKVGSFTALAHALGITKGAVGQWTQVPGERVLDVARASGWSVTPHELRPDLYPNATDGLPAEVSGS